jgi:hypothetical protein
MRFSKQHKTYSSWLRSANKTDYTKSIIRKHNIFPKYSLNKLRKLRLTDYFLNKVSWKQLTNKQKANRKLVAESLRMLRSGKSLKNIKESLGINKEIMQKHLGTHLFKRNNKWHTTKTDSIEIKLLIYEKNKGATTIVTKSSRDRSLIGKYFAKVKQTLKENDNSCLKEFENRKIIDSDENIHYLETNLEKIKKYEEAIEEPEFLEIYRRR